MNYKDILTKEDEILSQVLQFQGDFKVAVNNRNWTDLMKVISKINLNMDAFNKLDEERERFSSQNKENNPECKELLRAVRGKLVRCRTENKALGDYLNITRKFVKDIIENAIPHNRNKLYSRNGSIIQRQPESVVVNTLY